MFDSASSTKNSNGNLPALLLIWQQTHRKDRLSTSYTPPPLTCGYQKLHYGAHGACLNFDTQYSVHSIKLIRMKTRKPLASQYV
jgi:hypothetical protein